MKIDKSTLTIILIVVSSGIVLIGCAVWPRVDLIVSGWFYEAGKGFVLSDNTILDVVHTVAYAGARIMGLALFMLMLFSASQRTPVLGLRSKGWLFLFLGLVLGPGLVANVVFKDHWGRPRPREIVEFGGSLHFSPALRMSSECKHNCSFVSGDGAFGFYLPAVAYLVPPPKSRRLFWAALGAGSLMALTRIVQGAHFLSDTLYAALFMQGGLALLYSSLYSWKDTRRHWINWLFLSNKTKT